MKVELSKDELQMLNSIMGYVQDVQYSDECPSGLVEIVDDEKFNELNEKIAELLSDCK